MGNQVHVIKINVFISFIYGYFFYYSLSVSYFISVLRGAKPHIQAHEIDLQIRQQILRNM